jgi:hypothetical protein
MAKFASKKLLFFDELFLFAINGIVFIPQGEK